MKQSINRSAFCISKKFTDIKINSHIFPLEEPWYIDLNCWCLCEPRTNNALNVLRSSAMLDNS